MINGHSAGSLPIAAQLVCEYLQAFWSVVILAVPKRQKTQNRFKFSKCPADHLDNN